AGRRPVPSPRRPDPLLAEPRVHRLLPGASSPPPARGHRGDRRGAVGHPGGTAGTGPPCPPGERPGPAALPGVADGRRGGASPPTPGLAAGRRVPLTAAGPMAAAHLGGRNRPGRSEVFD